MLCNVIPGLFFIEQDLRAILEFKRAFQKTVCADDSIFTKTVLPVRSEVTAVMECQFRSPGNCISKKEYLQGDKGMVLRHRSVCLSVLLNLISPGPGAEALLQTGRQRGRMECLPENHGCVYLWGSSTRGRFAALYTTQKAVP